MDIISGSELPDKVLKALRISNNPKNTNPWGNDFYEMSNFQWINAKHSDYKIVVDKKSGGFFGREPTELYLNGYKIILHRDFKKGSPPFILYEKQLYFLLTINFNTIGDDIINAEFGKINMEKYLEK